MVAHPGEYPWSSYRVNTVGEASRLITPHPHYETLGTDEATRQTAYRQLFQEMLGADLLNENRRASNGNFVMDNARFAAEIVAALNRRVIPGKPRRPRKTPQGLSGDLFDDKQ